MFNLVKLKKSNETEVTIKLECIDCTFANIFINDRLYYSGTIFDCCNRVLEAEQRLHALLLNYCIESDFEPLKNRQVVVDKKSKKEDNR